MRVEVLRGVGVQSDVQRVRVVKHLQVFGGWGRPWRGERAVPALVARYFVVSRAAEEARDRRGDEAQRVAEPVQRADDNISETLRTLRDHFRSDLALDSREALRKTLRGVSCSRLGLVELILEKQHGSSVVAVPLDPAKTLPDVGEDATCLALVDALYPPDAAAAESWSRKAALLVFLCLVLADALLPDQGTRRRVPRLVASLVFVYLMR